MKITILTVGSRGDVEPYVALGKGLRDSGHEVRIATHGNFKNLVVENGLDYFEIEGDPQALLGEEVGKRWIETGERISPFTFVKRMMETVGPIMRKMLDDYIEACRDTNLILTSILAALGASSIGEKMNVRVLPAYLQHVHSTKRYPSPTAVPRPTLGSLYNLLTYPMGSVIYWQMIKPHFNRWRRESLRLPPFDWLFPRMAAVVHHGGAGTTAAGLRAGVPSVVAPFFADQFFWGWRVFDLGVGSPTIPRKKLTSERLAAGISEAVNNKEICRRAALLSERIHSEDGVETAVSASNRYIEE